MGSNDFKPRTTVIDCRPVGGTWEVLAAQNTALDWFVQALVAGALRNCNVPAVTRGLADVQLSTSALAKHAPAAATGA